LVKRDASGRRRAILSVLTERQAVRVDELARLFEISEVTIRKDLAHLEVQGLLLRRHGGACVFPPERSPGGAAVDCTPTQQLIVKTAAKLIKDHNRIVIDSGSTTAALVPELGGKQGLVVMTNSLGVANAINQLDNPPALLMTGGTWDPHSSSLQGKNAEKALRCFDFDQLFIGADGLDPLRGTTTFNELLGLSQVMAEVSRQRIVIAEASKFGRRIPNLELPWSAIDILVTDNSLTEEQLKKLEKTQTRVVLAG